MTDMLETKKYTFTVEGETERWYLLWLRDRINEQEGKEYKVAIEPKVQQHPMKFAKGVNAISTPEVIHSFNWPVIYDNFSIFRAADQADRERSEYGYISVADAGVLSFHSPLVFSFDYTWQTAFNILFNSNVVFAIFLLIVLAPVFSEEYSSGAANVILSTRYGKSKVIQAKFTAAFLIAAISAVIFCVVILLACGAYFAGFEG